MPFFPLSTFNIVESIPVQVNLTADVYTYDGWMALIESAQESILFAEYYWTLTDGEAYPEIDGGWEGASVYAAIKTAHNDRGVSIKIVQVLLWFHYLAPTSFRMYLIQLACLTQTLFCLQLKVLLKFAISTSQNCLLRYFAVLY